jgi:hypothetical protein
MFTPSHITEAANLTFGRDGLIASTRFGRTNSTSVVMPPAILP